MARAKPDPVDSPNLKNLPEQLAKCFISEDRKRKIARAKPDPEDSPNLNNLQEHLAKLEMPLYNPNSEHWVDIVHINNPHSFYARPTIYRHYMEFIEAKGDRIDKSELKRMMKVMFYSKQRKQYVRGEIFDLNEVEGICSVNAIDYGFIEKSVSFDHIYCPYQELKLPALAVHCRLADCEPIARGSWDPEVAETMEFFVKGERAKMTIKENRYGKLVVELRTSHPDDIATLLAYVGDSQFGFAHGTFNKIDNVPCPQKAFFPDKGLHVGDKLHVRSLDVKPRSLSAFYVAKVEDYKIYIEEKSSFTTFSKQCQKLSIEDLKEGKPVSVNRQFYCNYERGIIKKVTDLDGKAIVYFIDTGETEEVSLLWMRNMSDKFFSRSSVAIFCTAQESQRFDYRLEKYLYPGYEYLITIKEVGDMFDKPCVVQISPLPDTFPHLKTTMPRF